MENIFTNFHHSKLEFNKVLNSISLFACSKLGREEIINLKPKIDPQLIIHQHALLSQLKRFFIEDEHLNIDIIYNFNNHVEASSKNVVLSAVELYELSYSVDKYFYISKRFNKTQYSDLQKLFSIEKLEDNFFIRVLKNIDKDGNIDSNISSVLKTIRFEKDNMQDKIRKTAESFYKNARNSGYTDEEIISIRDGLPCVAIKSSHKNKIDGIVLDYSSSGQTVFIAPRKVIELHNDLIMLIEKEKKEIIRILTEFSDIIKLNSSNLTIINDELLEFDILYAKTRYSHENDFNSPEIIEDRRMNILSGKHPLLGGNAVPLDINIGDNYNILVITGPNTGGKTVVLKTIGLFCLMVQSGIAIPASSSSKFCIFKKMFVDIGDEQSIEQSLSTFSAHIKKIIEIINNSDVDSLILIDEFGAGTDPVEGAALAMSILKRLINLKSIALMTTHYSALKNFAASQNGIENASMEFDTVNLMPTYRIKIGIPGSSKALEISARLGMPEEIISTAKTFINEEHIRVEELADKLEKERLELQKEKGSIEKEKEIINDAHESLIIEKNKLSEKERELNMFFKNQESQFLKESRREFENIIKLIKTKDASKDSIKQGKELFERVENKLNSDSDDEPVQNESIIEYNVGDDVLVISKDIEGTIIDKTNEDGKYLVQVGLLKIIFPSSDLKMIQKQKKNDYNYSFKRTDARVQMTLDLRGFRYEEAEKKLDKFVEESINSRISFIRVIHGVGTGALKKCIQDYFESSPYIIDFEFEKSAASDSTNFGVTVARLRA